MAENTIFSASLESFLLHLCATVAMKTTPLNIGGLHGAAIDGDIDISQYPDLLIGIVPIVNLEWIRKIGRDTKLRGYTVDDVRHSIQCRMHDYVHHITPQFSRTHINFQMVSSLSRQFPAGP